MYFTFMACTKFEVIRWPEIDLQFNIISNEFEL